MAKAFIDGFTFGVKVIGVLASIVAVSGLIIVVKCIAKKITNKDE